ncbi:MAG: ABC transporter permease, partial [Gemmatimonadetes bacterium]|nr:ABC transporter permease [Gemmatimonadota bacterium]
MLGNYLITALRHLWRERGYAAVNLFGLAVGLCLCLLTIQFAAYQLSVGDFHEEKDRVFRVIQTKDPRDWPVDRGLRSAALPLPLGPTLKERMPEVEETVRIAGEARRLLRVGDKNGIRVSGVRRAESSVFQMFSLSLLRGDPKTALSRPYTMVLTEPLAQRLFGEDDPIGQIVRYNEAIDCTVTGIVGQLPSNSLLQFSALLSLATVQHTQREEGWRTFAYTTFVQLNPNADAATVAERISDIVQEAGGLVEDTDSYALQPLKSIYFDTEDPNGICPSGNPMHLALFATLAMVLLTIAGFNYVNLATARAEGRMHEIGVRKALGAYRSQLIRQLLGESVLLSVGATLLGVAMAEIVTPFLPAIGEFDFEWSPRWTISTCAGTAALAVAVGLAAGAYPAWVVACFQPAVLERRGRIGGARLRQGLVVAQFTVTATLMTITLLIWHQISFIQSMLRENSVLGSEPEQVVIVDNPWNGGLTADQARTLKTELLQDSPIAAVSLSVAVPGQGLGLRYSTYGREEGEKSTSEYEADGDFVEIMGLRIVQGRPLTDAPADAKAVVINETAVRWLELEEPLGKMIPGGFLPAGGPLPGPDGHVHGQRRVVGVIEDFHFRGPRYKVEPLVIAQLDERVDVIIVRVQPGHLEEALKVIDDKWAAAAPYRPIRRHSLEEVAARLYSEEQKVGRT